MTKFADQLYDDLMQQHGPALASTEAPAASRRHLTSHRVVLAAGVGGLAVAASAGALVATGGTPAYALTTHPDGTVSLAVYQAAGIAQANAKLRHLGDRVVVVPVRAGCPALSSLRLPAVPAHGRITVQGTTSPDGSTTVNARGVPAGDILVVGTETTTHGREGASETGSRLTSVPAPHCVSLPSPPPANGGTGSATSG